MNAAGLLLFNGGYIYRLLRNNSAQLGIKWSALTLLKDVGLLAPVTQKQLAQTSKMSGPSVSVAISQMVKDGLLKRKLDPNDRRSSTLSLTASGQQRLEREGRQLQESLLPLVSQLGPKEIDDLVRAESILSKLF